MELFMFCLMSAFFLYSLTMTIGMGKLILDEDNYSFNWSRLIGFLITAFFTAYDFAMGLKYLILYLK